MKGIITLCGSTRFYEDFRLANLYLTMDNWIVLSIGIDTKSDHDLKALGICELNDESKTALDKLHKEKIDLSSAIMVIDVDAYIGQSTQSEIAHAIQNNKTIYSYRLSVQRHRQLKRLAEFAPTTIKRWTKQYK